MVGFPFSGALASAISPTTQSHPTHKLLGFRVKPVANRGGNRKGWPWWGPDVANRGGNQNGEPRWGPKAGQTDKRNQPGKPNKPDKPNKPKKNNKQNKQNEREQNIALFPI